MTSVMPPPRVSVIVAVRNGATFLREALESIAAQTFRDFEIVVIDGHSTDETPAIARGFPGARYFLQGEPGLPQAYQQGVDHARGSLLAWLSHDDIWVPGKLEAQVEWLDANPSAGFVTGRAEFFIHGGGAPPPGFRPELLAAPRPAHIMETLLVRRETWDALGGLRGDFSVAHDVEFFSRAADLGVVSGCLEMTVVRKRIHTTNNTSVNVEANNRQLLDAVRLSLLRERSRN